MSSEFKTSQHDEQGAALIIVLGLVAVISAWAATAAYEDMLSMRRAENMVLSSKAELACLSTLALAKAALKQDVRDGNTDNLDEEWAQASVPFPIDDGLVSGQVVDANRYLNLNDLVDGAGMPQQDMVDMTKRLFTNLDLDSALVDALVDWMDKDDTPYGAGGAEDANYFGKDYKVKNAPLDRWQELSLIEGFSAKVLAALKPVATIFPLASTGMSMININTVQKDILLAMFPVMTNVDVEDVMAARPYSELKSLKLLPWAQGAKAQLMFSRLSVASDIFMVRTHAIFGHADWREEYGLLRQREKISLLWRERLFWDVESSASQVAP